MADTKISAGADPGLLLGSDKIPLARPPSTTAFAATMNQVVALAGATALNNVGRNLLHNPLFNVAQRGAGPWTVSSFTLDRWSINPSADAISVSQGVLNDAQRAAIGDDAATVCAQIACTGTSGAGAFTIFAQAIEDVRRLGEKTITVSFWAAGSGTLKVGVNINQAFGSGGSPSPQAPALATGQQVTIGTVFSRYSITIPMPSTAGKTFGTTPNTSYSWLMLCLSSGATNNAVNGNIGVQAGTFQFWGVQLEVGAVATPLEKPDPQQDLAKCQRFYQVLKASARFAATASGQTVDNTVMFPPMRAAPTVIAGAGDANSNISSAVFFVLSGITNSGRFEIVSNAAGDAYALGYVQSLSADL